MPWIRFTENYHWRPAYHYSIAYKAGMTQNVTRECAAMAIAAGKAIRLYRKNKEDEFSEVPLPTVEPATEDIEAQPDG